MKYAVFCSCPKGLEYLLQDEVKELGLQVTQVNPQGVYGEAELVTIYQLCLWSRLANRIQLILFSGQAYNEQSLYQLCQQFPWQTVFSPDKTIAIEFHGSSAAIRNSMYGAQVIKDAIVDQIRAIKGQRPMVDRENPQILLHAYLKHDQLTVSLDLVGYSLHQRGYRAHAGQAPIKENVAAALLIRARWPELAARGYGFHDPFCGAGTIVIEAAMMAAKIAPGLLRHDQALVHWLQHQPSLWEKLRKVALQSVKPIKVKVIGSDSYKPIIEIAKKNAERAGVLPLVEFFPKTIEACRPALPTGLMVANPPYGERMGEDTTLIPLYQQLGETLHAHYQGWEAAILTANPLLAKAIGLRATKQYTVFNGSLECKLYTFSLTSQNQLKTIRQESADPGIKMLANRLSKNYQHFKKWAKRNQISCYRVYDADLPEYAYAIDVYNDYAVLQEYAPPITIPSHRAEKRSLELIKLVPDILNIAHDKIIIKQRKPQKGTDQYQKIRRASHKIVINEGKAHFKINLSDYIDTGIFLDHRRLRLLFASLPAKTRFLNCFCYTATASVHAALAGALTTNIDLSKTYLSWAQDNFRLNHLDLAAHQFIQQDCREWLKMSRERFDVIFLDPPSFSNSKRMSGTLDIQRDHQALIQAAMRLLSEQGKLYFSTNLRHFKISPSLMGLFAINDITASTLDIDFKRNKRIHQCFLIQHAK